MLVYGIIAAREIPIDVFPDFAPVQVVVQTEAPGFSPMEVESLITLPLEAALGGTPKMTSFRSISTIGVSVLTIIFEDGTDILSARQLVTERLQAMDAKLPSGAAQPALMPIRTAVGDVIKIGLLPGDKVSLMDLRTLADWTIRRRLMSIPGVSNVVVQGGEQKQYQVLVNPDILKDYDLSLNQVIEAARGSNTNAAGGFLRTSDQEFLIRGIGRAESVRDIEQSVVTERNGLPVRLGTVASVKIGPAFLIGDAVVNGERGIIFNVTKQPWSNTLSLTRKIESALTELEKGYPAGVKTVVLFRQADFIETGVKNMLEALLLGGALVVVILFLFLQNWRTAIISLTAIPLSLLAAIICLKWQGGTINTMTLGGLAIAIGEVVDDAIIDVENVYRRLKENHDAGNPVNALKVIFDASKEIRRSVIYATFIVALVFLPVISLAGLEGKIFKPLAISYIVAIFASLVVALTVTPALCSVFLRKGGALKHSDGLLLVLLKKLYEPVLSISLKFPQLVLGAALVLFLCSLVPLAQFGSQFLPEFDESNMIVASSSIPGTSLDTTVRTGIVETKHLLTHKQVLGAGQHAGRAPGSDDYGASNFSEFDIRLTGSVEERKSMFEHVREDFTKVPGIVVNVGSYISHRMDHVLSGVNSAIAVKVFGPDLDILHSKAAEIEARMKKVDGAVDVHIEPIVPIPQISIRINREAAARYGLKVEDLSSTITAAFNGVTVSQVIEDQKLFDLFVWFEPEHRKNLESIKSTLIDTPSGSKVPIASVATVSYGKSPNTIRHESNSRYVVVQANVSGQDLGRVIRDIREKVGNEVTLPTGYYVIYGGQFEAQEAATKQILFYGAAAVIAIFVLLVMAFGSVQAGAIVMLNLPLALIGGIWAIALSGGVYSVGSLVGFITLFGISTRNGIMLVTHFNHLLGEGKPLDAVLREGAMDRLSPVLMTALTAALGVLPIAILGGAGRELEQPMAAVILGGMFSSTALTLIVVPALFKITGGSALRPVSLNEDREETGEMMVNK